MKSVLVRNASVPVLSPAGTPSSSFSNYKPFPGVFSGQMSSVSSPRISLHLEINHRRGTQSNIRRAFSESDIARSLHEISSRYDQLSGAGSRPFPSSIPEEEHLNDSRVDGEELMFPEDKDGFDISNNAGDLPGASISIDEIGFSGSGIGSGRKTGGGNIVTSTFSGGSSDRSKIGANYQEMLKLNPSDSLLLRNYGKFLHEVENDTVRAEEYYGRAILASPGDGELLSLYGKLVWETQRDEHRAKSYFDRAVYASPDDCSVLGSYAHFLWEVEAEEEEEVAEPEKGDEMSPALIAVS